MSEAEDRGSEQENGRGGKANGTLLVVDGHSLAFRAFFGLPVDNFTTNAGQPTNAVWGFATMLVQVIEDEKPDHIAVAFDMSGGTFRNKMLPQYKGTRDAAPEDLLTQLPIIQRLLTALGVKYVEMKGYEGDDIIGTMAKMGEDAGYRTLVLSGDRDAFQLIDDDVTVLYPGRHFKDLKHMTPESVFEKYHVTPQQYPDLAAMRGETADNIPGVPGVGDGFAAKWINQYGSLEGVLEHADELPGKKGQSLRDNIDQVRLNRKVNAVLRDLDLGVQMKDLVLGNPDLAAVDKIFAELEFGVRTKNKILKAFNGGVIPKFGAEVASESNNEPEIASVNVESIQSADDFHHWVDEHIVSGFGPVDGSNGGDAAGGPGPDELVEQLIVEGKTGPELVDQNAQCHEDVGHSWALHASGSSKPGASKLETVTVLAGDQAAMIEASLLGKTKGSDADDSSSVARELQMLIDRYHGSMVVFGYKEQLHMLATVGIRMASPLFDVKLAGYLVHPDFHAENIEKAASHFLNLDFSEQPKNVQGELDFDGAGETESSEKHDKSVLCGRQVATLAALAAYLAPLIDQRQQFGLLRSIELPVSRVLSGIEDAGARVDIERLTGLLNQFSAEADQAQNIAFEAAGHQVNLQSPKQLQQVLFDEMGLKPSKRTKNGSYTTNAATLQSLYVKYANNQQASDFLGALLQHRETNKLKQIVQTLLDSVNRHDMRIHTTFEQTVAATGRLSSVDPNLQNIPNRNATGREIRSAFVAGPGYQSLLSCDYSQVELRIMADLSGDETLIEAFKSGTDFHKYVASLVYGLPIDQISADQRSHVKAMSYGLAYGLSTYGLSQQLKISPAEADVLKDKYFATFGKVHDYLESLVATAKQKGYTETLFGRRRYFRDLKSTNRVRREAAERGALNAPIQGTAADIMKIAMIRTDHALRQAGLNSRVILQIHDELVLEIAPGESESAGELVRDAMEHAVDLAVPLSVSIGEGANWQDAAH
ncbi:DNA polymerase I [Bifidobacterium bohemicum]|uniref:DNA polymerase I n=1 Tax=Bifidobacterium bohemicum DSM 22767 TaxID=1437606 RepID=A0A086ZJY1_9BIFI|nr:DNA polymerase I [Bifidobacterium bohemicum]KFI46831.1 DNA-directed DNA polymerase I [Bifidobacterium bohemicum DSM 22767]SCB82528.1 DNA polymerase I [Bifidobacterium bohemicum]